MEAVTPPAAILPSQEGTAASVALAVYGDRSRIKNVTIYNSGADMSLTKGRRLPIANVQPYGERGRLQLLPRHLCVHFAPRRCSGDRGLAPPPVTCSAHVEEEAVDTRCGVGMGLADDRMYGSADPVEHRGPAVARW